MTATEVDINVPHKSGGVGRITRVIGPVVDVEFGTDEMPDILNALTVDVEVMGEKRSMTLEVALHVGDNMIRAIALKPTDGLQRGAEVRDTGAPISVPVGEITKGHVWNVTGDVLNAPRESVEITERWPIHRSAPKFDELVRTVEVERAACAERDGNRHLGRVCRGAVTLDHGLHRADGLLC